MKKRMTALVLVMLLLLSGCVQTSDITLSGTTGGTSDPSAEPSSVPSTSENAQPTTEPATESPTEPPTDPPTEPPAEPPADEYAGPIGVPGENGYLVVIDAGHQRKGDYNKSPIGPGSTTMKANVSSGTCGKYTDIDEYVLNLAVAKMLEQELLDRGYGVIMVRTTHDVNISNIERAKVANYNNADAFIRIHANGSDDPNDKGAMTICQTKDNPYNADIYEECYALSAAILDGICASSGCVREKIWETDTMVGINWSQVPVTIVEMGYMSNEEEDLLLATDEYRMKMALGIANGLDAFFGLNQE